MIRSQSRLPSNIEPPLFAPSSDLTLGTTGPSLSPVPTQTIARRPNRAAITHEDIYHIALRRRGYASGSLLASRLQRLLDNSRRSPLQIRHAPNEYQLQSR